jgi:hypothetical protein
MKHILQTLSTTNPQKGITNMLNQASGGEKDRFALN